MNPIKTPLPRYPVWLEDLGTAGTGLRLCPDQDAYEIRGVDPETGDGAAIVIHATDVRRLHRLLSAVVDRMPPEREIGGK